jgi:hypothetical protein
MEKVRSISFDQTAHGTDRKHWLNALASIAGNHFQSKAHKYSMAQVEKFFSKHDHRSQWDVSWLSLDI